MQAQIEKEVFQVFGEKYSSFFPQPIFHPSGIVEMNFVPTVDDSVGYWSDEPLNDIIDHQLSSPEHIDEFLQLCGEMSKQGILWEDLVENGGNIGVENGQILLIDWGYTDTMYNNPQCGDPIEYDTMRKRIAATLEL